MHTYFPPKISIKCQCSFHLLFEWSHQFERFPDEFTSFLVISYIILHKDAHQYLNIEQARIQQMGESIFIGKG